MHHIERRFLDGLRANRPESGASPGCLEGYAAVFNTPALIAGTFREVILPGAFTRALQELQNVAMLVNHDANLILGRTRSGTLVLLAKPMA
jgi:uncharacterized protein